MKKSLLILGTMLLTQVGAYAVDGQVLINQSTVMAAGGFPYIISNPGSYKLTGNLQMSTTSAGNHAGLDIAIAINSSFVDLDLNGFAIIVTNSDPDLRHNYFAIAEIGTFSQVSIKNGNISVKSSVPMAFTFGIPFGIYLHTTTTVGLADLTIFTRASWPGIGQVGTQFDVGSLSLLRHNRFAAGEFRLACPSLFVENFGLRNNDIPGCTGVNNGGF